MTERVRVVVMGADEAGPPPGIGALEGRVDLRFAATRETLANSIADADAIFAWRANRDLLPHVWGEARRLRGLPRGKLQSNRCAITCWRADPAIPQATSS